MKIRKLMIMVLLIAVLTALSVYGYLNYQLHKIQQVEMPSTNEQLSINDNKSNSRTEITNIALLGLDSRDNKERGRSDSIIILSIDWKHQKIKLSSIMRDTYVEVEGYGMTKITHAYAYGGPLLTVKTLNSNFNLNIKDYAALDFKGFERIIDAIGGVPIVIKSYEVSELNETGITTSGSYNLNGAQALQYSRIRHRGNADFERTDRQRLVLSAVFNKLKEESVQDLQPLVKELLPYMETSLTSNEIMKLAASLSTTKIKSIEQARFPADGHWQNEMINGVYYLVTDLEVSAEQMHEFIYEDKLPEKE